MNESDSRSDLPPSPGDLLPPGARKLSVGCGTQVRPGWTNLDIADLPGVDVVCDLNSPPYPFADASFDYVECNDVLEHLQDFPGAMRELHRILAPGGQLRVTGPHFTSYTWATDPTHLRAFAINTFEYFAGSSLHDRGYYFDFAFAAVERRVIGFQQAWYLPWNRPVEWLVNRHRKIQGFFESTFLSRLFPAHKVEIDLRR